MGDADIADVTARASGADGLHHRLLRADSLDRGVRTEAVGEVLELRDTLVTAFDDDVGGAVLLRELLPVCVPTEDDDVLSTQLARGENAEQADRTVAHDGDGLAGTDFCGDSGEPAGAEHVGGGEQAGHEI